MTLELNGSGARAVLGAGGDVWTANPAFCKLVGREERELRRIGWRELVHAPDRRYLAAQLVDVLAGEAYPREFDVTLVNRSGEPVGTHLKVELARDAEGRPGWFMLEASAKA